MRKCPSPTADVYSILIGSKMYYFVNIIENEIYEDKNQTH